MRLCFGRGFLGTVGLSLEARTALASSSRFLQWATDFLHLAQLQGQIQSTAHGGDGQRAW